MIHILCYSCNTHIADTDVQRLDWPLTGEMFSVVYPGWFLRPGMLNLDIFCPACGQFPFSHDPYTAGANAVGKNLNIRGADGKPVVMTVKQILILESVGCQRVPVQATSGPGFAPEEALTQPKSEKIARSGPTGGITGHQGTHSLRDQFPCLTCGAKKRFHKKGCALIGTIIPNAHPSNVRTGHIENANPAETGTMPLDKNARLSEKKDLDRAQDPVIASIAAKITGSNPDKGDGPPTEAEVKEMLAEREGRMGKEEPELRPGEGYLPQQASR